MATTTQPRASIDSPTTIGPKSSPSSPASGPDSEIASVLEELPKDGNTNNLEENKQGKKKKYIYICIFFILFLTFIKES